MISVMEMQLQNPGCTPGVQNGQVEMKYDNKRERKKIFFCAVMDSLYSILS